MGQIDEDAPCEFGADDIMRVAGPAVRRARSVAVGSADLAALAGYKPGRRAGLILHLVRWSCASSAHASNGGASMTVTSFLTCA